MTPCAGLVLPSWLFGVMWTAIYGLSCLGYVQAQGTDIPLILGAAWVLSAVWIVTFSRVQPSALSQTICLWLLGAFWLCALISWQSIAFSAAPVTLQCAVTLLALWSSMALTLQVQMSVPSAAPRIRQVALPLLALVAGCLGLLIATQVPRNRAPMLTTLLGGALLILAAQHSLNSRSRDAFCSQDTNLPQV